MVDSFICTSDMGDALLSFIGSDDYKRIVNSINSDKESAFAAGVAVAVSVMLVRCPKYVGRKYNDVATEEEEALRELREQNSSPETKPE